MKHNPVAKFAHRVNKATVQRDRTKYNRKQKHKGDGRDDRRRPFSWPRRRLVPLEMVRRDSIHRSPGPE